MKRLALFICTLLCANVLFAEIFEIDGLYYQVTSTNPAKVAVNNAYSSITTANIPATVSYYGITYSVTSIGDFAFEDCSSLSSVTIPNSVTSIGRWVFRNCNSLTTLNFNATNCEDFTNLVGDTPFENLPITTINIGDSVERIPKRFAYSLDSLTSVTIPNSVTSIGEQAFLGCSSLTSVTIGNSVTSIGEEAFWGCSSLTTLNFNAINYESFNPYNHPFENLPITTINIGDSVQRIPAFFAYDLNSLTSINIPNSVTSIGDDAFCWCNLTSITIPNSVTSIGWNAFYGCSSLTSVTIPNSVTSIGDATFQGCSSLTSVDIPNSVTSIGWNAFAGCSGLTSITIPNSVTSIGDGAFGSCSSLTSITIPNSVTSIGYDAFTHCSSLTSITIPNSVTSIEYGTFAYCSSLTSVTIPNSVTSIGGATFKGCSSLTSITIPNSVTSIGGFAFKDCSSLTSVTCLSETAPILAEEVFLNTPNEKNLIVPCGALYNYINSDWSYDFSIIIGEGGYNVVANVNNSAFGSVMVEGECYSATLTATANACYQFVGWNDGNTENPRLVTLSSDTTLTANFEEIVFDTTITATINAGEMYSEFGFNESEAGTYVQNLQTVNGCDSTITLILDVNSSLMDVVDTELSFYPNPTNREITFSQAIEKVEVIDLIGKTILTFTNAKTINVESLPAGAYYLRLTNNDKAVLRKLIKE